MPLRWKTSGLLGSRRANAATNHQSAANRALISRLFGVNRPFIGCEGARQRFTHVAEPFTGTFLLDDVTVTYDHPPHQRLRTGGREPDDAAGLVDFVPGEAEDLVLAPGARGRRRRAGAVSRGGALADLIVARSTRRSICSAHSPRLIRNDASLW